MRQVVEGGVRRALPGEGWDGGVGVGGPGVAGFVTHAAASCDARRRVVAPVSVVILTAAQDDLSASQHRESRQTDA